MLWRLEYSNHRVEPEIAYGKEDAFKKALKTLLSQPFHLSVDFYKLKGDEKIYVATYDIRIRWNEDWKLVKKKKR